MNQIAAMAVPLTLVTCLFVTGCNSPETATIVQPPGTEAVSYGVSGL